MRRFPDVSKKSIFDGLSDLNEQDIDDGLDFGENPASSLHQSPDELGLDTADLDDSLLSEAFSLAGDSAPDSTEDGVGQQSGADAQAEPFMSQAADVDDPGADTNSQDFGSQDIGPDLGGNTQENESIFGGIPPQGENEVQGDAQEVRSTHGRPQANTQQPTPENELLQPTPRVGTVINMPGQGLFKAAGGLMKSIVGQSPEKIRARAEETVFHTQERYEQSINAVFDRMSEIGRSDWAAEMRAQPNTVEGLARKQALAQSDEARMAMMELGNLMESVEISAKEMKRAAAGAGVGVEEVDRLIEVGERQLSQQADRDLDGLVDENGRSLSDAVKEAVEKIFMWLKRVFNLDNSGTESRSSPAPGM